MGNNRFLLCNKMSFRYLQGEIIVPYASRAFQARMHTAINFLMSLSGHPVDGGAFDVGLN